MDESENWSAVPAGGATTLRVSSFSRTEPKRNDLFIYLFIPPVRESYDYRGMSLTESPPRRGLRVLTESVSELLNRVGEEIVRALEKRSGGPWRSGGASRLFQLLRLLLAERMTAAAQEVVGLLERDVAEYRRQLERQSRLLEAVLNPVVRLKRSGELA